jgi:hypothetical protein
VYIPPEKRAEGFEKRRFKANIINRLPFSICKESRICIRKNCADDRINDMINNAARYAR